MTGDPKRLTVVGATDLERSLLQAARRERPSPELTARMAAGLGISVAAAITATAVPVAAAKTTLAAWVPAGVLAVAVAAGVAGVVGVRMSAAPERSVHAGKPAAVAPAVGQEEQEQEPVQIAAPAPDRRSDKIRRRAVAPPPAPAQVQVHVGDLRDQIALIDAARTAVKAGSTERALLLLRRYEISYTAGAFRPEALALRIEALDADGRDAEAHTLAREFLVRYPQSPLADRVARVAQK